jgi:hypothetical protein
MEPTDHRIIITKLRKPRMNEEKRKIIVKRAASGDLLKGIPPVFFEAGGRRYPLLEPRSKSRSLPVSVSGGLHTMRISDEEEAYI